MRAICAIGLKFSAFVKNRLGYKMTLTVIFLLFFFTYTVPFTDHFEPNYVVSTLLFTKEKFSKMDMKLV